MKTKEEEQSFCDDLAEADDDSHDQMSRRFMRARAAAREEMKEAVLNEIAMRLSEQPSKAVEAAFEEVYETIRALKTGVEK